VTNEQQRIAIDKEMMCRQVQGQLTTAAYLFIPVNGAGAMSIHPSNWSRATACSYTRCSGSLEQQPGFFGEERLAGFIAAQEDMPGTPLQTPAEQSRRVARRRGGKPQTDDITPVVVDIC
jgi:hypothetical protein